MTIVTDQWKANRRKLNKTLVTEDEYERVDSSEDGASDGELQGESTKQSNDDNVTLAIKEKYLKTPLDYAEQVCSVKT